MRPPKLAPETREQSVKKCLLAIVGPTAVGKSARALDLAAKLGGEIISADSRQVYRHMDIGTGKPSTDERAAVRHHLIDVVDPDEEYSLALFLQQATSAIDKVLARGNLPMLVGGSGQYVWALLEGWKLSQIPPYPELREHLEARAADEGHEALHRELARVDERAAGRTDPRNVRRVVRALEVVYARREMGLEQDDATSDPGKEPPPYTTYIVGLSMDRSGLYQRIDDRVDSMIEDGWTDEVRGLLDRGYGIELPSMSSLGYSQLARVVAGELSLESAVEEIKHRTHRFARNQFTWFRTDDERIHWSNSSEQWDEAERAATEWLAANG